MIEVIKNQRGILNFKFLNGDLNIPDTPGIKVVDPGCGSGKTTAIKELIKSNYNSGILYSASTIKECNDMYDWIVNNLIDGVNLSLNDIASIHNSPRVEEGSVTNGVDLNLWKYNPYEFKNKKILICTHHKLLNEYPELLIGYNLNKVSLDTLNVFDRVRYLNPEGVIYNPRKYVFIDELPRCSVLKKTFNINDIRSLGLSTSFKMDNHDGTYSFKRICHRYDDYSLTKMIYEDIEDSNDKFKISKSESVPVDLKKDLIISSIHRNFYDYVDGDKSDVTISCNILNLDNGYSNIMLFEGTGDLLYTNNKYIEVYSLKDKYNSDIEFKSIHNPIKRKIKDFSLSDSKDFINNIDLLINEVKNEIVNNEEINKVLIVTWMNLKSYSSDDTTSIIKSKVNEDLNLSEYIDLKLTGQVGDKSYSIIHYQSGLDRATNEFRDYDTVIFLGEFHIPNNVISIVNQDLGSNTTPLNFSVHQIIQAICRTRIRNHRGEKINVYFTDDWSSSVIRSVKKYLVSGSKTSGNDQIYTDDLDIKPKWRKCIEILSKYDINLLPSMRNKKYYTLSIGLTEIYNLIPMSEKKIGKYYPLINYLRKFNIELDIVTSNGSNQYEIK